MQASTVEERHWGLSREDAALARRRWRLSGHLVESALHDFCGPSSAPVGVMGEVKSFLGKCVPGRNERLGVRVDDCMMCLVGVQQAVVSRHSCNRLVGPTDVKDK